MHFDFDGSFYKNMKTIFMQLVSKCVHSVSDVAGCYRLGFLANSEKSRVLHSSSTSTYATFLFTLRRCAASRCKSSIFREFDPKCQRSS